MKNKQTSSHIKDWSIIPRRAVQWFAIQMERRLVANDDKKDGWDGCEINWLLDRVKEELRELEHSLKTGKPSSQIKEAADAANFLMMIASNISDADGDYNL